MANWWDEAEVVKPAAQTGGGNWWDGAEVVNPAPKSYTGKILPFSTDAQGNVSFDPNAGVLGSAIRTFRAPGDALTGRMPVIGPDGHTTPQAIDAAANMAGWMASPAPMAAMRTTPAVPSAQELKAAADTGYTAARNSGIMVRGDAIANTFRNIQSELANERGIGPRDAPKAWGTIDDIIGDTAHIDPTASAPFATAANLESIRKRLGIRAGDIDGTEALAGSLAKRRFEDFRGSIDPAAVVAGTVTPEELASLNQTFRDARGNYRAAMASNDLTGALDRATTGISERADARAAAANSGANIDNSIRSRVASLLEKPREVSGFSDDELAALRNVVNGGFVRNRLRDVGNMLGGGRGLGSIWAGMAGAGGAYAAGHPDLSGIMAVGVPATGMLMKGAENALARRSLANVDEMVRARSPLYQGLLDTAPVTQPMPSREAVVLRALLPGLLGYPQPQQGGLLGR